MAFHRPSLLPGDRLGRVRAWTHIRLGQRPRAEHGVDVEPRLIKELYVRGHAPLPLPRPLDLVQDGERSWILDVASLDRLDVDLGLVNRSKKNTWWVSVDVKQATPKAGRAQNSQVCAFVQILEIIQYLLFHKSNFA